MPNLRRENIGMEHLDELSKKPRSKNKNVVSTKHDLKRENYIDDRIEMYQLFKARNSSPLSRNERNSLINQYGHEYDILLAHNNLELINAGVEYKDRLVRANTAYKSGIKEDSILREKSQKIEKDINRMESNYFSEKKNPFAYNLIAGIKAMFEARIELTRLFYSMKEANKSINSFMKAPQVEPNFKGDICLKNFIELFKKKAEDLKKDLLSFKENGYSNAVKQLFIENNPIHREVASLYSDVYLAHDQILIDNIESTDGISKKIHDNNQKLTKAFSMFSAYCSTMGDFGQNLLEYCVKYSKLVTINSNMARNTESIDRRNARFQILKNKSDENDAKIKSFIDSVTATTSKNISPETDNNVESTKKQNNPKNSNNITKNMYTNNNNKKPYSNNKGKSISAFKKMFSCCMPQPRRT